jgi:predicted ABC-type ATPase
MRLGYDDARSGNRPADVDQPGLCSPHGAAGDLRRQLADRLAAASDASPNQRDLRKRSQDLGAGHPSSPRNEDGSPRPREPSLTDFELPEPPLSDAEWSDHVQQVADRLDKALAEGLSTEMLHTVDPDHEQWTLERTRAHKRIIGDFYAEATDVPCSREAIIAGGLGGAGKTTVLDKHAGIDRSAYLTINPDDFKDELARRKLLPEVPGLSPMEASSLAHEESSYLARQLARRAITDGKNIIWDITMSSSTSASRRIAELRNAGYEKINAIFIDIPIEASVTRAEARHRHNHDRYLAGQGVGGRFVPPTITRQQADTDFGSVNRQVFEELKDEFDSWSIYDNSVDGRAPILIERSRNLKESDLESQP